MINLSSLNENQLGRIYLVANTPSYLFRHYRLDESVQRLARQNTVSDLVDFVSSVATNRDRTLLQTLQAYAALVALTFKGKETRSVNQDLFEGLDWARSIVALGAASKTATTEVQLTSKPTVEVSVTTRIPSVYFSIEAN